jgi:hypothetical protein
VTPLSRFMYGLLNAVSLLQCQGLVNKVVFGCYYDQPKGKELLHLFDGYQSLWLPHWKMYIEQT